jgi:hypothetical protein
VFCDERTTRSGVLGNLAQKKTRRETAGLFVRMLLRRRRRKWQANLDLRDFESIVANMSEQELDELQAAIDERRGALLHRTVVERRDHGRGVLQLESRSYAHKDGERTERGPYWYFHYREGAEHHTMYIGKTDAPEGVVDRKLLGF